MKKRTVSLFLAVLLVSLSFASCSQSTENAGDDDAKTPSADAASSDPAGQSSVEETEEPDPFADRDYGGRSFRINTSVNAAEPSLQTSNYLIEGPEELTGDAAPDAAFQRNKKVEDLLNLKLEFTHVDLDYSGVAGLLRNYVSTGADDYECFVNDIYGSAPITVEGGFHNGLELENLDFSKPWWYPDFMHDIAMNYNYQYMLAGDFFIDVLRSSHGLIFNKNLYTDLFGDGNAMYETVLNGEWTYDRLIEIQEASYADLNGNGQSDKGDRFGYVSHQTWGPMIPFLISANPGFVERDEEGYPTITVYNERSLRLTDYLVKVFNSPWSGSLTVFDNDTPATIEAFTSGRAVFIGCQRLGSLEYALFRDMEQEIGVVPYPKMDEADDYVTSAHDTSEVGLIPITVPYDSLDFVSAAIEVLCRETHREVLPIYYESSLKVKYTRDNTAAQMIDIIHDNIGDSFPLAWSNELSQVLMQATFYNAVIGDGDFASKYKALEKVSNKQLEKIVKSFRERTEG